MVEDEDELLDAVWSIVIYLAFILAWKLPPHLVNASQGIRLISHHEENEGHWLIQQLVLLKPRLAQEPFLPSMIPRSKRPTFCILLANQEAIQLSLRSLDGSSLTLHQIQNGLKLRIFRFLYVQDIAEQTTVLLFLVVPSVHFVDIYHVYLQILELVRRALFKRHH